MKKSACRVGLVLVALVTSIIGVNAQSSSSKSLSISWSDGSDVFETILLKPHEVKVNLVSSTLLLHPELAYDYTINPDLSVGSRLAFSIKAVGIPNYELGNFQMSPYVRWHFYRASRSGNYLRGFFVEANMAYTYYSDYSYNPNIKYDSGMGYEIPESAQDKNGSAFGLGLGLGHKWVTKRAWTFELGGFIGRNIFHPEPAMMYGNLFLSIGKRF